MHKKYTVGILQANPHTLWRPGGGELHARKYVEHGNTDEFSIELFDFNDPGKYDLLHYFGNGYQLNDFGTYARHEGIRVVGTPILYPSANTLKYRMFLRLGAALPFPTTLNLRRNLLHEADVLIANSQPEADYFTAAYDVPSDRIRVLGTGVDKDFFSYRYQYEDLPERLRQLKLYVLMTGRVTPLKNQLAVLRQLAGGTLPVVLVGRPDSGEQKYIAEIERVIDTHDHFHWIKGLDAGSASLKAVYARALCHVLWSSTEVAALVNLEAAALGCPIISRGHATTRSIMGAHALYAVNEKELEQRIAEVAALNPEKRMELTESARAYVCSRYTWEGIVAASLDIYRELLNP